MEQGGGHNDNDEGIEKSLRKMEQDAEQTEGKGCPVVLRTHLSQKASICCSPSLDGSTDRSGCSLAGDPSGSLKGLQSRHRMGLCFSQKAPLVG